MASGVQVGQFVETFGVTVRWETTKNDLTNSSKLKVDLYLNYYQVDIGERIAVITINGTDYEFEIPAISDYSSGLKDVFVASKTVTFEHDSAGHHEAVTVTGLFNYNLRRTSTGVWVSTRQATTSATFDNTDVSKPVITQRDISNIGSSSFDISAVSNAVCDVWYYSFNNGTTWVKFSEQRGTSVSKTLTGLTAGTTYSVLIRAKKEKNGLFGTSSAKSAMTFGGSVIGAIMDFNIENGFSVPLTKFVADAVDNLVVKLNGTTVGTFANYTNNSKRYFTANDLLEIYKLIASNQKSAVFTFELTTVYRGNIIGTSAGTATGTIIGNANLKVDGAWKKGVIWQKVSGTWKRGILFKNIDGTWKKGI